ncbi:hypothetical protein BDV24DRAFT_169397 [Aspergillus arachidicola]|uniref:MADS-box domain-containing protein n=1 Tax=Aspergillus arachidicola TaxID=656916 RepID=A0A5N6XS79_9EURO|nr:hypothetical protein BDV24DRAFT_169397 [Aspergillus arachidicola]
MGRKKILIRRILSKRDRDSTFRKRYPGLTKKAHELGVLCDQDVFLFVRNRETGRIRSYTSTDEQFIPNYQSISRADRQGPLDMGSYYREATPKVNVGAPSSLQAALRLMLPTLLKDTKKCFQLVQKI